MCKLKKCVCVCVGGDPVRRRDPFFPTEARVSRRSPPPEEAQDRSGALYDGVVHVCLLAHAAMGVCAARLGHVPLRRLVSQHLGFYIMFLIMVVAGNISCY